MMALYTARELGITVDRLIVAVDDLDREVGKVSIKSSGSAR
jgi:peptidyl-tRNA hydrolase